MKDHFEDRWKYVLHAEGGAGREDPYKPKKKQFARYVIPRLLSRTHAKVSRASVSAKCGSSISFGCVHALRCHLNFFRVATSSKRKQSIIL